MLKGDNTFLWQFQNKKNCFFCFSSNILLAAQWLWTYTAKSAFSFFLKYLLGSSGELEALYTNFLSCATKLECVCCTDSLGEAQFEAYILSPKSCFWSAGEEEDEFACFSRNFPIYYVLRVFTTSKEGWGCVHALCLELITYKISNKVILHFFK